MAAVADNSGMPFSFVLVARKRAVPKMHSILCLRVLAVYFLHHLPSLSFLLFFLYTFELRLFWFSGSDVPALPPMWVLPASH